MSALEPKQKLVRTALYDALLFTTAFLVTVYPAGLAFHRYGMAALFKFFASDAFYYLNVARRSEGLSFFTYDGVRHTNGFHPLWQWVLTWSFERLKLHGPSEHQLLFDFALSAVLCGVGVAFLALAASRLTNSRALALFVTIPGVYDTLMSRLLSSSVDNTESAPWSFVNGMESGLSVFWFGLLAYTSLRREKFASWSLVRLFVASVLLCLIVLSRLDDIFLFLAFAIAVFISSSERERWWRTIVASALPVCALGSYMLYNLASTGFLLPVSGAAKRDPKALSANLHGVMQTVLPSMQWKGAWQFGWDTNNWRTLQLIAPMAVAAGFLVHRFFVANGSNEQDKAGAAEGGSLTVLSIFATYVLAKGSYNLCLVQLFDQGHWYFTLSTVVTNLLLARGIQRLVEHYVPIPRAGIQGRAQIVLRVGSAIGFILTALLAWRASDQRSLQVTLFGLAIGLALVSIFAHRLAAYLEELAVARKALPMGSVVAVAALGFAIMNANAVVEQKHDGHYGDLMFEFWSARKQVDTALARLAPDSRVLEIDDGIMGYSLDRPTSSGTGLSTDRAGYEAIKNGTFLDLAYRRGFRILSSLTYWGYLDEQRRDYVKPHTDEQLIKWLVGPGSPDGPAGAERFEFNLLYATQIGGHSLYFLEFEPKDPVFTAFAARSTEH